MTDEHSIIEYHKVSGMDLDMNGEKRDYRYFNAWTNLEIHSKEFDEFSVFMETPEIRKALNDLKEMKEKESSTFNMNNVYSIATGSPELVECYRIFDLLTEERLDQWADKLKSITALHDINLTTYKDDIIRRRKSIVQQGKGYMFTVGDIAQFRTEDGNFEFELIERKDDKTLEWKKVGLAKDRFKITLYHSDNKTTWQELKSLIKTLFKRSPKVETDINQIRKMMLEQNKREPSIGDTRIKTTKEGLLIKEKYVFNRETSRSEWMVRPHRTETIEDTRRRILESDEVNKDKTASILPDTFS